VQEALDNKPIDNSKCKITRSIDMNSGMEYGNRKDLEKRNNNNMYIIIIICNNNDNNVIIMTVIIIWKH
jgi:hypothetical protein